MGAAGVFSNLQRNLLRSFVVTVLLLTTPAIAQTESRIALILGDGKYAAVPDDASVNGTSSVKNALASAGYKTIDASIISSDGMQWALDLLVRQLKKGGPESVGFVYFAGYSIATNGENYLIPANAKIAGRTDVIDQGFPLSRILDALAGAENGSNAVAIDACNGNPFYGDDTGFTDVPLPSGVILSTCAAPGTIVGPAGQNAGFYAEGLGESMNMPGIGLAELFDVTRWSVARNPDSHMLPWAKSGLAGDKPFSPAGNDGRDASLAAILSETALFGSAERSGTTEGFQTYLDTHPNGAFARYAGFALNPSTAPTETVAPSGGLDDLLWAGIKDTQDPVLLEEYLTRFPDGKYVALAEQRIAALQVGDHRTQPEPGEETAPATVATIIPVIPPREYTANLTGTDAAGWANLYLAICGSRIRYKATIAERNGSWSAELLNLESNEVVSFRQTESGTRAGQAVMYGRYGLEGSSKNKFVLQVAPKANGRVSLNIPNIGICAVGHLN